MSDGRTPCSCARVVLAPFKSHALHEGILHTANYCIPYVSNKVQSSINFKAQLADEFEKLVREAERLGFSHNCPPETAIIDALQSRAAELRIEAKRESGE